MTSPYRGNILTSRPVVFIQKLRSKILLLFFLTLLSSASYAFFSPLGANACVMDYFLRFCQRLWCPILFLFALFLLAGFAEESQSINALIRKKSRTRLFWDGLGKIACACASFAAVVSLGFLLSGRLYTSTFCNWNDPISYHALYYGAPNFIPAGSILALLILQLWASLLTYSIFFYILSEFVTPPFSVAITCILAFALIVSKTTTLIFSEEWIFAEFLLPLLPVTLLGLPFALHQAQTKDFIPLGKGR